ncbi:MAG: hypothetical protein NC180_02145 [Muribaculaceae bacterium]|nr:hypothetical protein [Roseburia sp.]MCM1431539.1 hypothetical protein [Muribaculaceae bacterium]MCM1492004.1 hypothetical protein [Muribaculaceae bacterium]
MAFIDERIPREKWEFVKKYAPSLKISKYSHWVVDYENEIYWTEVGFNSLEHLERYLLIWKGKKTFVETYGWIEGSDDCNWGVVKNIIEFQADASLKPYKKELLEIVIKALSVGHTQPFKIEEIEEPDFSKEFE